MATLQDWSISEVFRRAVELLISQYPSNKLIGAWKLPEPRDMGAPLVAPDSWGDLLAEDETARA